MVSKSLKSITFYGQVNMNGLRYGALTVCPMSICPMTIGL
jgi:hypothetical protein